MHVPISRFQLYLFTIERIIGTRAGKASANKRHSKLQIGGKNVSTGKVSGLGKNIARQRASCTLWKTNGGQKRRRHSGGGGAAGVVG